MMILRGDYRQTYQESYDGDTNIWVLGQVKSLFRVGLFDAGVLARGAPASRASMEKCC